MCLSTNLKSISTWKSGRAEMTRTNLVLSTADAPAWPASWRFQAYATTAPSGQTTGMCSPHELLRDRSDSLKTPDSSSCLPNINQKTQFQKRRNPNPNPNPRKQEKKMKMRALPTERRSWRCWRMEESSLRNKWRGLLLW